MQNIGNKLIEIHITDSNLESGSSIAPPLTGFNSEMSGIVDGLFSAPALMFVFLALVIVVPLAVMALVLSIRRHGSLKHWNSFNHAKVPLAIAPICVALAVVVAPLVTLAAEDNTHPLESTPIQITIDKAETLFGADITTVTLTEDASGYVMIYAATDSNFSGYLDNGIAISANQIDDNNQVRLGMTKNLIYTTAGPVVADDTIDFAIAVAIDESLPIGDYVGEVSFYGESHQLDTATMMFICNTYEGAPGDLLYQKTSVTLNVGEFYTLQTPNEMGLFCGECDELMNSYHIDIDNYWMSELLNGDDFPHAGDLAIVVDRPIVPEPDPSGEVWYEQCWLSWDSAFCEQFEQEIDDYDEAWIVWDTERRNFDWESWAQEHLTEYGAWPIFDGLKSVWGAWRVLE